MGRLSTALKRLPLLLLAVALALQQPPAVALPGCFNSNSTATSRSLLAVPLKTCYDDMLPLESSIPTISHDMKAILITHARLTTSSNTVHHLRCRAGHEQRLPFHWPMAYTNNQVQFKATDSAAWEQLQQTCNHIFPGLSVALSRNSPLMHFGHRMLTDLPALWAMKTWLTDNGIDVSNVQVVFADGLGQPAWGPANFKPILLSLGFKSYEPRAGPMLCFENVILMPYMYYSKWYKPPRSLAMLNMWRAPEMLYDTDSFHIKMLMHIREEGFGLPARIPFAPAGPNRTIVLASRDRETRKKAGFRLNRVLENEAKLVAALRTIPDTHVHQVELGTMAMRDIVLLLERTSLFLGYHGAGFDNLVFLPRGAAVLEILPKGTDHSPLYPTLAHRTGKEFARYVNNNDTRQTCHAGGMKNCLSHFADLVVDIGAVMKLVKAMLHVQQAAMMRYSFDDNV